jgi:hypothetical protein
MNWNRRNFAPVKIFSEFDLRQILNRSTFGTATISRFLS